MVKDRLHLTPPPNKPRVPTANPLLIASSHCLTNDEIPHSRHVASPVKVLNHDCTFKESLYSTRLRAIFARDILLYYSYVQPYEALAQKLFWFSPCDHGVERRRPLPWAVVVVCPWPSISPWPWHHGRRGDMLSQGHTTTTARENWRWWYPIFSWLF